MPATLKTTPRADGFRMPGEFEPHAATWMLWPHRPDVWRDGGKPAQRAFAAVAAAIARFEPVTVGVAAHQYANARHMLPDAVRVVELSSNDAWMRDCGPTFVVNDAGAVRGVDWTFNAWGGLDEGLYFPWDLDEAVAQKVLETEGVDRYKAPLVVEGGAIHVDGEGTLFTSTSCLLNPNRNPHRSQPDLEHLLREYLNVEKIIWLDFEPYEETDGHIDTIMAVVRPGVLVLNWTDDPDEPAYAACRRAYEQLSSVTDAKGRPFELHKLPQASPPPFSEAEAAGVDVVFGSYPRRAGDAIGGEYVNFYIANGGIVMPTYDDPNDEPARQILADLFPDRQVVGVPAREIAMGGGMIHCITQQQPRG